MEPQMDGRAIRERVVTALVGRFEQEATALPTQQQQTLLSFGALIVPALVDAHAVLFRAGLHPALDLGQSLESICAAGAALLAPYSDDDETAKAAQLTYEAVGELLSAVSAPQHSAVQLVKAGVAFGRADVRLTQVITGLWEIMAAADQNQRLADAEANRRKRGGEERAAALKQEAAIWKAQMLPLAIEADAKHPHWSRQQIAIELLYAHKGDKEIGLKSIEDWLKDEAEQPNGPIRSGARKKRAKHP
jgi:hypothetical protein